MESLRIDLSECFGIVRVELPEEGYDRKRDSYSDEYIPELTGESDITHKRGRPKGSVNGVASLCPDNEVRGMLTPRQRKSRVDALCAFYSTAETDEVSPFVRGKLTLEKRGIGPSKAPPVRVGEDAGFVSVLSQDHKGISEE